MKVIYLAIIYSKRLKIHLFFILRDKKKGNLTAFWVWVNTPHPDKPGDIVVLVVLVVVVTLITTQ